MTAYNLITIDPEILGGTPVFSGTRVPIQTLFDYIEAGDPLERFLDHFPSVHRNHAVELLEEAQRSMLNSIATKEVGAEAV